MSSLAPTRRFKSMSRLVQIGILPPFAVALLVIVYLYFVGPLLRSATFDGPRALASYLALALVVWHPALLLLFGLASLIAACGAFARGRLFTSRVVWGVRWTGAALMAGAFAHVVTRPLLLLSPWATQVMRDQNLHYPRQLLLTADMMMLSFTIGAIGSAMILLSFVIGNARRLDEEMKAIF